MCIFQYICMLTLSLSIIYGYITVQFKIKHKILPPTPNQIDEKLPFTYNIPY